MAVLRDRIDRYRPERYPVQHATAQFHLGVALANAGRLDEADRALGAAVALFDPERLPAEHGAAANARGAVLRLTGCLDEACAAFGDAITAFARAGRAEERGAALHNLGLVEAQQGRPAEARRQFEEARAVFDDTGQRIYAAAAARELGSVLLACGELSAAASTLEEAVDRAEGVGDAAGVGAAANLLGLAYLATDRAAPAADAFRRSAAAHPRRVRPEGYAMAKANVALALQRAGDQARADLAAGQALAVPVVPAAAREVARGVLGGEDPRPGALLRVLDVEPPEGWPGVARDELARWLDLAVGARNDEAAAWVDGVVARGDRDGLLEAWLGAGLELPPSAMEGLLRDVLRALAARSDPDQETFRRVTARVVARFPLPQLLRLQDIVERLAAGAGIAGSWR